VVPFCSAQMGNFYSALDTVKCSLGSPEEYAQAIQSLQTAKAIVVDITALATLRLLGLTKLLATNKYAFIVSQHTSITVLKTNNLL